MPRYSRPRSAWYLDNRRDRRSGGGVTLTPRIFLSGTSIAENAAAGTLVGSLSVENSGGSYTFSLTDTAGNRFALDGADVERGATALNYEAATSHTITVSATGTPAVANRTFTINVTNIVEDPTPDAFTFTDVTAQPRSTRVYSNWVHYTGTDGTGAITVTGGEYQIADNSSGLNATSLTSSAGTIAPGKYFRASAVTSASYSTAVNVQVTAGGVADTFTITTEADPVNHDMALVVRGQSNGIVYDIGPPSGDVTTIDTSRAKIWVSGAWAGYVAGTNSGAPEDTDAWGPEAQFVVRWLAAYASGTLYIIKDCTGSTDIDYWLDGGVGGDRSEATILAAKATLSANVPIHEIYCQGEQDGADTITKALAYQAKLTTRNSQSRSLFDIDRIALMLVKNGTWTYTPTIRSAQNNVAVADPDTFTFDTADLNAGGHRDAASTVIMGDRAYECIVNGTSAEAADVTAPLITSGNSFNVDEGAVLSETATANEQGVTWSKGGADAALITLNTNTGAWSVIGPADHTVKPTVVFTLTATDLAGNASSAQTITITVNDAVAASGSTWNTADKSTNITLSNSDRTAASTAVAQDYSNVRGVQSRSSGQLYLEWLIGTVSQGVGVGLANASMGLDDSWLGETANAFAQYGHTGATNVYGNSSVVLSNTGAFGSGDVVAWAVDLDTGGVEVFVNNVSKGTFTNGFISGGTLYPAASLWKATDTVTIRTVASQFSYSPPSGYSEWG